RRGGPPGAPGAQAPAKATDGLGEIGVHRRRRRATSVTGEEPGAGAALAQRKIYDRLRKNSAICILYCAKPLSERITISSGHERARRSKEAYFGCRHRRWSVSETDGP